MPVRAFFDGSWNPASDRKNVLSLAGICAPEASWPAFDHQWGLMLEKHDLVEEGLHMAKSFNPAASARAHDVIKDVAEAFLALTNGSPPAKSCVCSIDIDDYNKLKAAEPSLIDKYSMCTEVAFNGCVGTDSGEERQPNTIFLYFDNNEKFMHKIRRVWEKKKKLLDVGWPRQIAEIWPVSRKDYPAIQAVDVLAWLDHRHHVHGDVEVFRQMMILCANCDFRWLDFDAMNSQPSFFRPRREPPTIPTIPVN
jgi:hypothetical protein